jgi:hypothetical protein
MASPFLCSPDEESGRAPGPRNRPGGLGKPPLAKPAAKPIGATEVAAEHADSIESQEAARTRQVVTFYLLRECTPGNGNRPTQYVGSTGRHVLVRRINLRIRQRGREGDTGPSRLGPPTRPPGCQGGYALCFRLPERMIKDRSHGNEANSPRSRTSRGQNQARMASERPALTVRWSPFAGHWHSGRQSIE